MATLNATVNGSMRTTNRSGHAAYKIDDRTKLMTMALTSMLGEPKFYGDNTNDLIKLAESMCKSGDGEFVAKMAVWARTKGNLRSVSHALMAVAAHHCGGKTFIRPAARAIASMRGDDGTEILASFLSLYGKPINHALMRGIRDALEHETPFEVAKYQSRNRSVKLRDTLRLTHPNAATPETEDAMGGCIAGTLPFPKSWETELSERGNTKEVWDELISEHKIPFMAALRNLRNMLNVGANVDPILDMISDRDAVARSRQLPFRFYSAYRELVNAGLASTKVVRALDAAITHACRNADRLAGRTAVLIDRSGSMDCRISAKSQVSCIDVAGVLGAMVTHISDDAAVFWFDSDAGIVPMTGMSVISDISMVPAARGGTDMAAGFRELMSTGFNADRIIVLSDNEVNGGAVWSWRDNKKTIQTQLDAYRRKVGHDVWCHAIDLQGYGTAQFIGPKVNIMAGWSDAVLHYVSLAEQGFDGIVRDVDALEL